METWTLSEIRIFSDMSFIFENGDTKTSLLLTAWNTLEKYKPHPDYKNIPVSSVGLCDGHLFSCQINEYPACPMTRYAIYAA